jgi:nucleoid-associated protein YgaU
MRNTRSIGTRSTRTTAAGAAALAALAIGCGSAEEPPATAASEPLGGSPAAAALQADEPELELDTVEVDELVVDVEPAEPAPDLPDVAAAPAAPATSKARTHTVARGETLRVIAEHYYGDRNRAREIFEANRGTLSDPNRIQPGQELAIP